MSGDSHLVQMANDIGDFFRAEPDRNVAIEAIANHINKFWTRRMREKLMEQATHDGAQLDDLPRAALGKIAPTGSGDRSAAPGSGTVQAD